MVEINNQRKAFLDMLAVLRIDNGRQKTRNHGYDVIVGGELFTGLLRSPSQTCHAKPKTQINRRRTLPASSCWWMPTASAIERLLSEKSGRCGIAALLERRFTYD